MNRIQITSDVHAGKPCVAGTRIPVEAVLELVREGFSFKTIIRDYYPPLEPDDIKACIQFAIDVINVDDLHINTLVECDRLALERFQMLDHLESDSK